MFTNSGGALDVEYTERGFNCREVPGEQRLELRPAGVQVQHRANLDGREHNHLDLAVVERGRPGALRRLLHHDAVGRHVGALAILAHHIRSQHVQLLQRTAVGDGHLRKSLHGLRGLNAKRADVFDDMAAVGMDLVSDAGVDDGGL